MEGDGGGTRAVMKEISARRTKTEDGRRMDEDEITFILTSIVAASRMDVVVGIAEMKGRNTVRARRTRTGGVSTSSLAEEEKEARGRRMRAMWRRTRREVVVGGRYDTDHTLYFIVNTVIHRTIACIINASGSLLLVKFVTTPAYVSIIHRDLVFRTCGGPAPGAAPHHPEVLLPLPSRTLGRGSVPDKRTSSPRGAGPKLPWRYAKAPYRNITDAGTTSKRVKSPPPSGGSASCPQLPRPPSVMAMARRRGRPPAVGMRTARPARDRYILNGDAKLFV